MSRCWFCGKLTLPESAYGAGRHKHHCGDCDVKWVTPRYWHEHDAWNYRSYKKYRARSVEDEMKRFMTDGLVDFASKGAPSAPA